MAVQITIAEAQEGLKQMDFELQTASSKAKHRLAKGQRGGGGSPPSFGMRSKWLLGAVQSGSGPGLAFMAAPALSPPPVQFEECPGWKLAQYSTGDANFRVLADGTVLARHHTTLHGGERTFVVQAWDSAGTKSSAVATVRNKERLSPQVTCRAPGSPPGSEGTMATFLLQ